MFDMEEYKEMLARHNPNKPFHDKYQDLRIILAQPEVMPCEFDSNIEFWIERISLWGKVKIKHTNTNPNKSEMLTKAQFLSLIADDNMLNLFGKWFPEKLGYKSLVFKRDYISTDGTKHQERIWIDIDLKPEIVRGMKFSESDSWFSRLRSLFNV